VGFECGSWMAGGLITISGKAKEFLGVHMTGKDALIVSGKAERRCGGEMKRGTIVLLSESQILPSFKQEAEVESFDAPYGKIDGPFVSYSGDYAESKKPRGLILVKK